MVQVLVSLWDWRSVTMFPAAGALVLLLYLLLLHELLTHLWASQATSSHKTPRAVAVFRHKVQEQPRRAPHTLDALWRRMKQATETFKMDALKHALITTTIANARAEARRMEQERVASKG